MDTATRVGESALAQVHFMVRVDPASPPGEIDTTRLTRLLSEATQLWDDDFRLALARVLGEEQSRVLHDRGRGRQVRARKSAHWAGVTWW